MIMITGGAFQGKTEFAKKIFSLDDSEIIDGENCIFEDVFTAKCVVNFHLFIKRLMNSDIDPIEFSEKIIRDNSQIIIIINEIGCGIIPIEKIDRIWRETVGRTGCFIAQNSEKVIRVNCGIPMYLKGESI